MSVEFLAVGGLTLDTVIDPKGTISEAHCGGNAFYAAAGARIWADRVGLVSCAGDDYPEAFLDALRERDIDVSGIRRIGGPHEMVAAYRYDRTGRRQIVDSYSEGWRSRLGRGPIDRESLEGSLAPDQVRDRFDPTVDQLTDDLRAAEGVHLGTMAETRQVSFLHALDGAIRSLDSTVAGLTLDRHRALFERADLLLPSAVQLTHLFGNVTVGRGLAALAEIGRPRAVAIKVGRSGCWVWEPGAPTAAHVPAFPIRAPDPTGAGDAFCGGFNVGFIQTGKVLEAALKGNISASFAVEDFDARHALHATRREAEARLTMLRSRVSIIALAELTATVA